MDMHEKIVEWARNLGYQGILPDSFKSISNNPSTSLIWHQLLMQVKPKQEAQRIKCSNIIGRLGPRDEFVSSKSCYPIKQLEMWEKKRKLQDKIEEIQEYIDDKEKTATNYSNEHKIIAIKRRNFTENIKETEEKSFLLSKKCEAIQTEITEVEENLIFFKNLTPVESTEGELDVHNRLQKCVEKIETSLAKGEMDAPTCPKNSVCLTPQKLSSTNIFNLSDCSVEDYSQCEEYKKEIFGEVKCLEDKDLSRDLKAILYNTNSQLIFNATVNKVDLLKGKLSNIIMNKSAHESPGHENNKLHSISQLQAMQIENELHALKNFKEIRKIKNLLKVKEIGIMAAFEQTGFQPMEIQSMREVYFLQRREIGLTALCDCLDRQISSVRLVKDAKDELRSINKDIVIMQQQLVVDLRNINHKFELYKKMYKTMLAYREETRLLVKKLNQFTGDLSWTLPLTRNLHSKEIEMFKDFPLEYNRRINASETPLYRRDIMGNASCDHENVDSETLRVLLSLIDCPYSAPETVFYHLWQKKLKLQMQKSLTRTIPAFDYKTYTIEELQKQESFINDATEKFIELKRKYSNKSYDQDIVMMTEIAKLWLEFPFADYVSDNRLYDGKNIKHYQNIYNNLYKLINND